MIKASELPKRIPEERSETCAARYSALIRGFAGQQSNRGLWELRSCFSSTFQLRRQAIALFIFFKEKNISLIWFYLKDETII